MICDYLDQGLVDVLARRCGEDADEILSEVLAWFCTGRYEKILRRSCSHPEVLAWSCTGPYKKILWRSWWSPLQEVLAWSCAVCRSLSEDLVEILVDPLRGPCMKIFQMPCIRGASMKALLVCSWGVLVSRSCKILPSSSSSFYEDLGLGQGLFYTCLWEDL